MKRSDFKINYRSYLVNKNRIDELKLQLELVEHEKLGIHSICANVQMGNGEPKDRRMIHLIEKSDKLKSRISGIEAQGQEISEIMAYMDKQGREFIYEAYENHKTIAEIGKEAFYSPKQVRTIIDKSIDHALAWWERSKTESSHF